MIVVLLAVLGLCMGSFLNAMVYRIHKKMDWVKGRSQCDHCGHQLAAIDLVPLFSWLFLRGRCRYCRKKLSWQHPAVEAATAAVFALSYVFWPADLAGAGQGILFATWLLCSVGLMALLVYDFKWMLLPSKILYPTAAMAAVGRLAYILVAESNKPKALISWGLSVVAASGLFWLLYVISKGKWIGFGDVRLGLVTGTLLASPAKSLLMIFLASLLGTVFVIPTIAMGKKNLTSKLPFGPFLIGATFITILFGQPLIDWYRKLLGY